MKKFFKLVLTLLFITTISGLLFLPSPVEAEIARYCTMRSTVTLTEEQVAHLDIERRGIRTPEDLIPPELRDLLGIVGVEAGPITIEAGTTVGDKNSHAAVQTGAWGIICLLGTVGFVTRVIIWFLIPLFTILLIIGGIKIMTAAGDTDKVSKGKNFILYAALGFLLVMIVGAIPAMIRFFAGF